MTNDTNRLADRARAVLGSDTQAERWLSQESPLFDGLSPLASVATADGRRRVARQLSWFAGTRPPNGPAAETLSDLLNDPIMDLVLSSAGTGPEDLLRLCRAV
jgi:hypothetical protein